MRRAVVLPGADRRNYITFLVTHRQSRDVLEDFEWVYEGAEKRLRIFLERLSRSGARTFFILEGVRRFSGYLLVPYQL